MPDPLSIASAVLGLTTGVVTIRNTISKILEDHDAITSRDEHIMPTVTRLKIIADGIEAWQKLWQVFEATPNALTVAYWGQEGHREIAVLLRQISRKLDHLRHDFDKRYGPSASEPQVLNLQSDALEDHLILASLKLRLRQCSGRVTRAGKALFTDTIFRDHLSNLESWLDLLRRHSVDLFMKLAAKDKEEHVAFHRSAVQARVYLTKTASDFSDTAAVLQEFLFSRDFESFDVYLNHKRTEHLGQSVRDGSLEFHLSFTPTSRCDQKYDNIEVVCSLHRNEDSRAVRDSLSQNFDDFLAHAFGAGAEGPSALPTSDFRSQFGPWKLHPRCTRSEDMILDEVENLRHFLRHTQSTCSYSLHGDFEKRDKIRLAYELAEWALILLKTSWLSNICSCRIFRVESQDLSTEFRARVGAINHLDPTDDSLLDEKQWCEKELTNMHICRLGVLLLEIATGSPVPDLALHRKYGIEIDGDLDLHDPESTLVLRRKEINRKAFVAMGRGFMKVIDYCLTQRALPDQITDADLDNFYREAVLPLFDHYHKLFVEAPDRAKQVARQGAVD